MVRVVAACIRHGGVTAGSSQVVVVASGDYIVPATRQKLAVAAATSLAVKAR